MRRLSGRTKISAEVEADADTSHFVPRTPKGTFTSRHDAAWVKGEVGRRMRVEIWAWRSVSVRFMRALIHPWLGGRLWLRLLFGLEERYPHWFGENGQYPLIVIKK
jgi:hypothetical protein